MLLAAGLIVRLGFAHAFFLNPDEAMHYLLSVQPNLRTTYEATLPTSHPPLYIVFLHYWGYLGSSEFFLRLPSVLAATAFCWIVFRWMRLVTGDSAALIGLMLLLFSPSLIYLSTELRQYAFALLFCSAALYFLEAAFLKESSALMLVSAIGLWLAFLTHYSAFLFAITLGLYAIWRMMALRPSQRLAVAWIAGQIVAIGIAIVLFRTQISKLKIGGRFAMTANTYLQKSYYHPGHDHLWSFAFRATIRLFHYLFSQGAVGIAGFMIYLCAIFLLAREGQALRPLPSSRQLAFLLAFPLAANCALALVGAYPYGGTHHNAYLATFIFPGIAIALARWTTGRGWVKATAVGLVLLLCNLFPSPTGEYIRHADQNRANMQVAVAFLRQNTSKRPLILTDNQGGLLLSYYLCNSKPVPFDQINQPFAQGPCEDARLFAPDPRKWIFRAQDFSRDLRSLKSEFQLPAGQSIWLFQAGWMVDHEPDLRAELKQFGCATTHDFGRNIVVCRIALP